MKTNKSDFKKTLPAPLVAIVMGSDSDLPIMGDAIETLREFQIAVEVEILSAHRTPHRMLEYATSAESRGLEVIIAGAGGAAHLPGMVASATGLPVIGVPIALGSMGGLDALLSIVQMPRGIPVATVAIDNATNAAILAVRILALKHPDLKNRLKELADKQKNKVAAANEQLRKSLQSKKDK